MGLPYQFIASGYYTSDTTAKDIQLSDSPDFFTLKDSTLWGANGGGNYTAAANINSWWHRGMNSDSYKQIGQAASAVGAASLYATTGTSGGFSFIDLANPPTYSPVAITAVDRTTWVVSTGTTTGLAVGNKVRLIDVTNLQQFSGSTLYEITAVSAGVSFTLGYAATAKAAGLNVAVSGTTGYYKKVVPTAFYPRALNVAYITQASQAVVYFFEKNDFTAGEIVDFQIPGSYGMYELSNLTAKSSGAARVLSVTNSASESSITIDLDTTGFTAYAAPTTANYVVSYSPAVCMPAGAGVIPYNGSATIAQQPPGTNLTAAFDNRSRYLMHLGTNVVGANNSVMLWNAWKGDYFDTTAY